MNETGREAWMKAVKERIVPAIRAFGPNILIISAGFDAAETDLGNVGVDRRGERKPGVNLTPKDYEEMTARLVEAVESCPEAKGVVSILEGGYGRYVLEIWTDRIFSQMLRLFIKVCPHSGFDKSTAGNLCRFIYLKIVHYSIARETLSAAIFNSLTQSNLICAIFRLLIGDCSQPHFSNELTTLTWLIKFAHAKSIVSTSIPVVSRAQLVPNVVKTIECRDM